MEEKELKIIPPEGYEIDKENSTLECIKFKKKTIRWRDNEDAIIRGYFISGISEIIELDGKKSNGVSGKNVFGNWNVFATKKQAKSARAMARISQIMANDKRFGRVITDEEWWNADLPKYIIIRRGGTCYCEKSDKYYLSKIDTLVTYTEYYFLAFHTREQRDLFLEENRDLVEDYLMID